jgi:glutamate racemase
MSKSGVKLYNYSPHMNTRKGRFLVFDSGLGGLSVLQAMRRMLPAFNAFYVADNAAFPYGNWEEEPLKEHILTLMDRLIAGCNPDLVVIACNTASTLILTDLRQRHPHLPFVGTVPAIKPAAEASTSKMISVLATPATVKRAYTAGLIARFAYDCEVNLVAAPHLAAWAEQVLTGQKPDKAALAEEIHPAFLNNQGRRTDGLALACTHYPFMLEAIRQVAPWPVRYFDPAEAIARRVGVLWNSGAHNSKISLHANDQGRNDQPLWPADHYLTTAPLSLSLTPDLLARFGLKGTYLLPATKPA